MGKRDKLTEPEESYIGSRYEFKYLMNTELSYRVESYIESLGAIRDKNSVNGPYIVNSMYFETPFLDDYNDKEGSLLIRKKMRARMYDPVWDMDHERVFLEIKNKRNFNIRKERSEVSGEQWDTFVKTGSPLYFHDLENDSPVDRVMKERFCYLYYQGRYSPHIIVKYDRVAYLDRFTSKVRVTFDRNISTSFVEKEPKYEDIMVPVTLTDSIMEVKFNGQLPWWFRTLVDVFDLKRTDFSKYNHSVAKLRDLYRIPVRH